MHQFEKIGDQPEAQRFSAFSGGGGPGAVLTHVQMVFCHNLKADPGSIPIISTYFAHPGTGYCASRAAIAAATPTFRRRVDEMVAGTGRRPVVYLLEIDGIGSTACMARHGSLPAWEELLRYEIDKVSALPHAVVYIEAGYSDANSVGYTARALNRVGVGKIRGFFTNDTHLNWTIKEIRWAERISRKTHGAHFIVNTAQNGNGPTLNPHPRYQGVEDLCNPPGRGLGPRLTTDTGFSHLDALMWTAHAREQQRVVPRRAVARDVLGRACAQPRRPRELAAWAGVRERPVLKYPIQRGDRRHYAGRAAARTSRAITRAASGLARSAAARLIAASRGESDRS